MTRPLSPPKKCALVLDILDGEITVEESVRFANQRAGCTF